MTAPLQAPSRLLDDPTLGAELRADLEHAAQHPGVAYDVNAGLARFEASLAAGAAPAGLGTGSFAVRALAWATGAAILIGGSIGATQLIEQAREGTPRTHEGIVVQTPKKIEVRAAGAKVVDAPSADADVVAAAATPSESAVEAHSEQQGLDAGAAPPVGAADAGGNSPSTASSAPPRPVSEPDPTPSLADEARQINEARRALASDPAKTLALTQAAAKDFPNGAMVQEREGYAILALAALGRESEARERAGRYLERYPNGPLSKRVAALGY